MNIIVATYIYTEEVALHAHRELVRAVAPWMCCFPLFGLFIIFSLVLTCAMTPSVLGDHFNPVLISPLLLGAIFCLIPLLIRSQVRRQFRRNPNAGLQFTWRIDSTRLSTETQGASGVFEWSKLVRIKEVKDGFLLFNQPKLAQWLPKSAFASPNDLNQFREYVGNSGVKTDG